jgi:Zn-dependent protease
VLFMLRRPVELLGVALALLVGVVAHCVAQAAAARALGDRLPLATHRLSLDPKRHFEPFGIIVMLLSGVGWNNPVPLQEPRFRGGRGRYLLAVLAGPVTNLLLAVLALVALRAIGGKGVLDVDPRADISILPFADVLLGKFAVVNAALGVLTLLPVPPLDGARILWLYAPATAGWRNARYQLEERNIGIGLCVVLMLPLFRGIGLMMALVLAVSEAFLAPVAHALGLLTGF